MRELPHGRYRTNEDSLLLAAFCPRVRGTVFDLGAGVGTIGIAIAEASPNAHVVLVEIDADAAMLARENSPSNVEVIEGDVRVIANAHRGEAALVVCNPPYVPEGKGRPPKRGRRVAKMGDPDPFLVAARTLLGRRGTACFVYPTANLLDFLVAMRKRGLEPKRIEFVHASKDKPARVALVEAKPGKPGGLTVVTRRP